MRFEAIYGHLWTSRHSELTAWNITKDEWANGLGGIDLQVIRKVLDDLRSSDDQYPPTLPLFLKKCRMKNGLIDEEEAYRLVLSRNLDDSFVKLCFSKMNSWDFGRDTHKVLRAKFSLAYKLAADEVMINQKKIESTDQADKKICKEDISVEDKSYYQKCRAEAMKKAKVKKYLNSQ